MQKLKNLAKQLRKSLEVFGPRGPSPETIKQREQQRRTHMPNGVPVPKGDKYISGI